MTGAVLIGPATPGISASESVGSGGGATIAEASPGDAFARDLQALPHEVAKMLTGSAVYVDDIHFEGEAFGVVVRSPHPHAFIRNIDASAAREKPGVLAVLTGKDIASVATPLACIIPPQAYGRSKALKVDRPILAVDRVRHVGDGVAFVVGETLVQATEAAESVRVDYEPIPAALEPTVARSPVPIWPEAPDNLAFNWRFGDWKLRQKLFAEAAHVVGIKVEIPRVIPNPIEPRGAVALYDHKTGDFTLISNPQGVHFVRGILAQAIRVPQQKLRVVAPYVGGAFGSKIYAYPEHALALLAARETGRPVRWAATRTESFLSDTQGRGFTTEAKLALDKDLQFLALSVEPTVDIGAYFSNITPVSATAVGAVVQGGAYRFRAIEINVRGVFTNKVPMDAYRGAGRPEATYALERLIDRAAHDLGVDPAELRERNLPASQEATFAAVTGLPIAGGRFLDNQRLCLARADREGFEVRRTEAAARGRLRGFGFANYMEANGGLQVAEAVKPGSFVIGCASMRFGLDGTVNVTIGTQSSGQNHARPVKLYVSEKLGIAPESIIVREGDSSAIPTGSGTGGSKSTLVNSATIERVVDAVIAKGRIAAARMANIRPDKLKFEDGAFRAGGSRRAIAIAELAARYPGALDTEDQAPLKYGSSANGCHACEVEIDPETGALEVIRYTAVDDFGRVVDVADVQGQVDGGIAMGIGQALVEIAPAPDALQHVQATSPFGHSLLRARDIPVVDWVDNGMKSPTNVLGAKACGESGMSAAPPAVMNAIFDALRDYPAARDLQMPARSRDIWAVVAAGARAG